MPWGESTGQEDGHNLIGGQMAQGQSGRRDCSQSKRRNSHLVCAVANVSVWLHKHTATICNEPRSYPLRVAWALTSCTCAGYSEDGKWHCHHLPGDRVCLHVLQTRLHHVKLNVRAQKKLKVIHADDSGQLQAYLREATRTWLPASTHTMPTRWCPYPRQKLDRMSLLPATE